MKALKYEQRLNKLNLDVANQYSEMLKQHGSILLIKEVLNDFESDDLQECVQRAKELDVLSDMDIKEVRNESTGNVFDVYVVKVGNEGVHVEYIDGQERDRLLKFSSFDIVSQINILAEMENLV